MELQYLKEYKIVEELITDNLVKVAVINRSWQPVHFIFSDYYILCYGDIDTFSWMCTWKTAQQILLGNCYADNPFYLTGKLEHKQDLKQFDEDKYIKKMDEIKEEWLSELDDKRKEEFLEKWNDNEYLLDDVDGYRLGNLDEFFNELEISDYYEYYDDFYKLPVHYDIALEMLYVIQEYFKNKKENQNE